MANELPNYAEEVGAAVRSYWDVRRSQAQRSVDSGAINTGLRSEVTGGRHLDALQLLLVQVFVDAGIPAHMLDVKKRPVPGYFRRDKSWDIVVTVSDRVLAIIELKSITGNNPGQNFNNRTDEALGQAIDVWKAVEHKIIASPLRPWLGYLMLIEDNDAWNAPSKPRAAVWPADPEFDGVSPADRASIFFERMVLDRLLDSACVMLASRNTGEVRYKRDGLTFQAFAAAMFGRTLQFKATNPDLDWKTMD
ncbi:MAG: PaeR7I family type II restriction endonuclease [Ilumatobacteraceae bacterium]